MIWGFPLALKGKNGQPLKFNNTRTDKHDSGFWKPSFQARRCLIPVSEFAEAEGVKGAKTRTWFALPDEPVFAVAGFWRDTAEWGPRSHIKVANHGRFSAVAIVRFRPIVDPQMLLRSPQ